MVSGWRWTAPLASSSSWPTHRGRWQMTTKQPEQSRSGDGDTREPQTAEQVTARDDGLLAPKAAGRPSPDEANSRQGRAETGAAPARAPAHGAAATARATATLSEVAREADFSSIRYAQCWEDADVLLDALDVRP